MKRQVKCKWIFGLFVAVFFAACSGFFELGNEEIKSLEDPNKPPTTFIEIVNTANRYPVDVYYDADRLDKNKIVSVPGNSRSGRIPQSPTTSNPRSFYITYNLPVVTGVQVPYIPKGANGVIQLHIIKDQITQVTINTLSTIINANDALFDNIWLTVKNTGNSVCRLTYFTSYVNPENLPTFDFNPRITALYKFVSDAELSQIKINSNYSLPSEISSFEKGYLYEVEFDGTTATLKSSKLLTLNSL